MPPQFVASAGPETGPFVIYDNGLADLPFPENPLKVGALSSQQLWKWNGYQWNENSLIPLVNLLKLIFTGRNFCKSVFCSSPS